jgi:hypothetical protein
MRSLNATYSWETGKKTIYLMPLHFGSLKTAIAILPVIGRITSELDSGGIYDK